MKLTQAQENALNHYEGPCLVLAVPGAGKTTVLLHRIENLIENHGVDPRKIISITFSRAQAQDMEERFKNKDQASPHFSTIHSFAYDIVRAYAREEKVHLDLIEGKGSYNKYALVKRLYYSINKAFIKDDTLEEFFTAYSFIKNSMISPQSYYKEERPKIKSFLEVIEAYEDFKEENNLIDFDDMLTLALAILLDNEKILQRIRTAFHFIQVDEAQDTSRVQMEIIKLIAVPKNNLFMVADDDQAIYGFRGADPQDLLKFTKTFKGAKVYYMEENFRSTEDIARVSSSFIAHNKNRYKKTIKPQKPKGLPVGLVSCKNAQSQLDYVVEGVKKDLEEGLHPAILYRNNISSLALMDRFTEEGIDFYNRDRSKAYLSHFLVTDILDILRLSEDPYDIESYENIYYKLGAYLKKSYLPYLRNMDSRTDVFEGLLEIPGLKSYQKDRIIDLYYSFRTIKKLPLDKAISFIAKDLGYGTYLMEKSHKSGTDGYSPEIIMDNLKLISKGLETSTDLEDKIETIRKSRHHRKERLTLSTVHSAKGLEFDSVYLVDLVEGEFPSAQSQKLSPQDALLAMEEERRLFYVAMTRARDKLKLITIKRRNNKKVDPSQFFTMVRSMKKR
mgnify:CR=1 FL=1